MLEGVDEKIRQLEQVADPVARETARELVQALLEFTGDALGRMLELVERDAGPATLARLADDPVVSPLLLLHGRHPADLQTRVGQALESVRPQLRSHGGDVELVGLEEGRVRVRFRGGCQGCASSSETLKHSIEQAILTAAPDATAVELA